MDSQKIQAMKAQAGKQLFLAIFAMAGMVLGTVGAVMNHGPVKWVALVCALISGIAMINRTAAYAGMTLMTIAAEKIEQNRKESFK